MSTNKLEKKLVARQLESVQGTLSLLWKEYTRGKESNQHSKASDFYHFASKTLSDVLHTTQDYYEQD